MVVLDIPLLFEKGVPQGLAGVIVVSAPAWKQRQRVLRRPGMTHAKFGRIKNLQVPAVAQRRRADYIIDRKSHVSGKSVSVRVDLGVRRLIKKKKSNPLTNIQ